MAVNLSPLAGAGSQFFTDAGTPLTGGLLYTYAAGTTTPAATYSDISGVTANSNPIVLNAAGRVTGEVWLLAGTSYKFVLKTATLTTIGTWDNIDGVNDVIASTAFYADTFTCTAGQTTFTLSANPGSINNLTVSLDGAVLVAGTDFTWSSTTVVLTMAAYANQVLRAGYSTAAGIKAVSPGSVVDASVATGTKLYNRITDIVDVRDYGAVGTGLADDAAAIQTALNTGKKVYIPTGTYAITTTLRIKADGQIVAGDGMGNASEPARTTLKWTGAANGKMFSISDGSTENYQNCTIQDMYLDGNSLANVAIEAYSAAVAGGAWRNRFVNLTVANLTGANSMGIDLGSGAFPSFAHDSEITGCFIKSAVRGVYGAGAIQRFTNTTFSGCTDAIVALSGSAWSFTGCVFSQSGNYDFNGSNISSAQFTGCWFEDSVTGIYLAATAHAVGFFGCYLQTKSTNTTKLMDWGNAAGYAAVKGCTIGPTSGSTLIKNINASLEYDIVGTPCTIDSGYRMRAQGVNRANQANFAAGLTSDQANATGDGTTYSFNASAWTELYDDSASFAAATGVFTAPLYGTYRFAARVNFQSLAAAHTDLRVYLVANGVNHLLCRVNGGAIRDATNEVVLGGDCSVYLSPAQTAYLAVYVSGSTKTISVGSGSNATFWRTRFEGAFVG